MTDVALLRLVAQRVVGPLPDPVAVVEHLGAVQAQDLPGSLTSVALRTVDRDLDAVRAAFDAGDLVRTWPMRGTLHTVPARDAAWMVRLMAGRPLAAAARRRGQLGLEDEHLHRSRDVLVAALEETNALTRTEVLERWAAAGLATDAGRGYHLLVHLAQSGVIALGPYRDGEQAFVLLDAWVPAPHTPDPEEALGTVALRFVRSHGPVTATDLARWTGLPLREARAGIALVADELEVVEVDGTTYHLDPAVPELLTHHADRARDVHLLPGFDEVVLGYADRTATVPAEHAERIVPGRNGVFRPTVLHEGRAVGTWRAVTRRGVRTVEAEPFTTFPPEVEAVLPRVAAALP